MTQSYKSILSIFEYYRLSAIEAQRLNILNSFIETLYNIGMLKEFKYYLHSNNHEENKSIIKSIESFEQKLNEETEYTNYKK